MSQHVISVRTNVIVFVALLVLLFTTIGAAYLPLGHLHLPLALFFAAMKAVLIGLFFMHLYYARHFTWIVSIAALFWLGIFITLTLSDYLSREWWLHIPGK
jgi:cytochrome c oxidase subunit 4